MALVFPIVNDPDQLTDSAPSTSWELDSSPEFPTRGRVTSQIVPHNGQLVLQWRKSGAAANAEHVSVYRQGGTGWNRLDDDLKNKSDADSFDGGDVISWNGELFTIFVEWKDASTTTSSRFQIAKWDEATSTWSFETTATDGLHPPSGYSAGFSPWFQPRFFIFSNALHVFFIERVGTATGNSTQYRGAVSRRDNGSWTRLASGSSLFISSFSSAFDYLSSVEAIGSNAWYSAGGQIFKFDGSAITNMHSTEMEWLTDPTNNYANSLNPMLRNFDGVPSIAFTRFRVVLGPNNYFDQNNYYYLYSSTDGGTTWSNTEYSRPLTSSSTSSYNKAHYLFHNGKAYVVIEGQGPGVASNVGIWAYRLDGSTWTQLGGGQARANPLAAIIGRDTAENILFFGGAIWVPVLEPGATSSDPTTIRFYKTAK